MNVFWFALLAVAAYLLGSVPFGLLYGFARGVDIRKTGSKNIGATNVSRQFGFWGGFVPVFILDFIKAALPVMMVQVFGTAFMNKDIAMILIGVLAIIGHMFPVWLRFKGGKGVATAAGAFMVITPMEVLIALAVFGTTLLVARAAVLLTEKKKKEKGGFLKNLFKDLQPGVAISSITAAVFFPLSVLVLERQRTVILVLAILVCSLVIFQHRSNIARMIRGEHKS